MGQLRVWSSLQVISHQSLERDRMLYLGYLLKMYVPSPFIGFCYMDKYREKGRLGERWARTKADCRLLRGWIHGGCEGTEAANKLYPQ